MTRPARFTLGIDARKFAAAMTEVGRQMQKIADAQARAMRRLWRAFAPLVRETQRQQHVRRFGSRNVDQDGAWITDLCASWLHESCPSAHCDCRCHA